MRVNMFKAGALAVLLGLGNLSLAADHQVHAAEASKGNYVASIASIGIEQPWSRAMPPSAHTGAVFVSIYNQGQADQLVAAYSPIAETTELHDHIHQDGLMKMVKVPAMEVPAGGSLELKPGGYHIMLIGLKQSLVAGEHFPVRLDFAKAGSIELQVEVKSIHAGTAAEHMHH